MPLTETEADIQATYETFVDVNPRVLHPIFTGTYPAGYLARVGGDAPQVQPGDMAFISQPTDFSGLNLYSAQFVRAGADGKPEILPMPDTYPRADAVWLKHMPQVMYWSTRIMAEMYDVNCIYVTENGAGYDDLPPVNGEVLDLHRRDFLRNYLRELQRAIDDGVPVKGYFLWSFIDNYEWADGYARRFGVVYVDYATQQRTPKASALWYSKVIQGNQLV